MQSLLKTVQQLYSSISKIQDSLADIQDKLAELSLALDCQLQKIFAGSLIQTELNAQQKEDLNQFLETNRHQRAVKSKYQIKASGALQVRDGN
jgi:hypothetical protein